MAGRRFPVVRVKSLTKFKSSPPLFQTKTEVIEHDAVGVKAFTIRPVHRNKLRRQVQNLPELPFLLSDLFLGPLLFAQVEGEHDAVVSTFKPRATNKYGHAAAVFPEIFHLVCRLLLEKKKQI